MFKPRYKVSIPNPAKPHIVTLQPTAGTWFKAFAPAIVIYGGLYMFAKVQSELERMEAEEREQKRLNDN